MDKELKASAGASLHAIYILHSLFAKVEVLTAQKRQ